MKTDSIYKSDSARREILNLYDEKLAALNVAYDEKFIETAFGETHVVSIGERNAPPVVVLHGINAGAPVALEAVKGLTKNYRVHAVDTIGQAGKSADVKLSVKDASYGAWLAEVLDRLNLKTAAVVGVSYGSFILGSLIKHQPERIERAIFVVPIVFSGGSFWQAIFKLLLPMRKFTKTEKTEDLKKFMNAFYTETDDFSVRLQRAILLGVNLDTRRPPLLKTSDVKNFDAPVYVLAAEKDIFAPAEKTIKRCRELFRFFKSGEILPQTMHVPAAKDYGRIEKIIERWLSDAQ